MDSWEDLQSHFYMGSDTLLRDWPLMCMLFNSISDGSERWLFYDLVVILMWLCEEASHVYLCRHLLWMLDTVLDGSGPSKHLSLSHKPDPWLFLIHHIVSQFGRNFSCTKSPKALKAGSSTEWLTLFLAANLTWRRWPGFLSVEINA